MSITPAGPCHLSGTGRGGRFLYPYNNNSYFGSAFSPRLVVVNEPDSRLTFKLQIGRAFRAPTELDIYLTGRNFKLTAEKVTSFEVNAVYTPAEDTRDIPVILFSANIEFQKGLEDSKAEGYIAKPFELAHLVETVRSLAK